MQDLIRTDASISPREIFARMQGAWLEPRTGYMWQENTGATATTSGGQTIGKLVDLSAERVASQATAANRPVYGVRRNLLTYSEDFSNGWWNDSASATTTTTTNAYGVATKIIPAAQNNRYHRIAYQGATLAQGYDTGKLRLLAKADGYNFLHIRVGVSPYEQYQTRGVCVNLTNGAMTIGYYDQGAAAFSLVPVTTVTLLGDGWYEIVVATNITTNLTLTVGSDVTNTSYTGDGMSGIWVAQLDFRVVVYAQEPTYQRITTATDYDPGPYPAIVHDSTDSLSVTLPDLGGGVFSSAGSVYFGTPQGMSCLHNQSIGTTYNLPAPNTDIYGVVITPARLAPPLEQRLALYMHRLAGLSDADFFWQEQATDGMEGQLLADDNDTILLRA